jgi:hypothetical protein
MAIACRRRHSPIRQDAHRTSVESQWKRFGSCFHVQRWWLKTLLVRGACLASHVFGHPRRPCPTLLFLEPWGPVPLQAPLGIRTTLITARNKALTEEPRIDNAIDCTFVVSGTHDTQDLQTTTFGCVEVASAIISPRRNKRTHLSSGGGSIADSHDCN